MAADAADAPPLFLCSLPAAFIHSFSKYLLSTYHHVPGYRSEETNTSTHWGGRPGAEGQVRSAVGAHSEQAGLGWVTQGRRA